MHLKIILVHLYISAFVVWMRVNIMPGHFLICVTEFEQIKCSGLHCEGINFSFYLFVCNVYDKTSDHMVSYFSNVLSNCIHCLK